MAAGCSKAVVSWLKLKEELNISELQKSISGGKSLTLKLKKSTAERERACRSLCALANREMQPAVGCREWKKGDVVDWVYLLGGLCHFWRWIGPLPGGWVHGFITPLVCRSVFLTKSFVFCGVVKKVWGTDVCDGFMF